MLYLIASKERKLSMYNNEDEIKRMQDIAARRTAELQKEELRRIWAAEQQKKQYADSAFAPDMDSAFAPDMDSAFARPYVQQPQQPYQSRNIQQPQQPRQPYANGNVQQPQQPRQPYPNTQQRPQQSSKPNSNQQNKKSGKRRKRRNPVKKFITTVLVLVAAFILIGVVMVNSVVNKFNHIDTEVSERPTSMKGSIVNVLLVGQDARSGQEGQRSDSMIICSINKKSNKITLISLMRDTYVQIPGYGGNKLNAAFAYGGFDLLDQTIEENFGITIDANAEVDFEGFLAAMTAVGSLEIELTAEEAQYMNENPALGLTVDDSDAEWEVWNLTEGKQKLSPSQLLCYSRMRYVGNSDWDRTNRQRTVISAALSKVKHGHFISGFKMADKAASSVTTDMDKSGMLGILFPVVFNKGIDSYLIPAEGTYSAENIDGMACLVPDIEANRQLINEYINGK